MDKLLDLVKDIPARAPTVQEAVVAASVLALSTHAAVQVAEPGIFTVLLGYLAWGVGAPLAGIFLLNTSIVQSLLLSTLMSTTFTVVLFSSIAIYRLFFHRLSRFPGPRLAGLSKFWYMQLTVEGRTPARVAALHERYGDVVRIGPNELSILDSAAINKVLGHSGKMHKGPWYLGSFAKKGQSVHALRGIGPHADRRKWWDRGFGTKALLDYAPIVKDSTEEWITNLKRMSPGIIPMSDWANFLAFDVMGELGFGMPFGMLSEGKPHFYLTFIEKAMTGLTIFSEISWIMPLLSSLPAGKEQDDMYDFSWKTTMARKNRGTGRVDVFSYLVGEDKGAEKATMTDFELDADVRTIIIAGSDTTATTLTFSIFHLLQEQKWLKALQKEVEPFRGTDYDISELGKLPVLNAIINETLRYNTVVPSKSQRIVPKGGTDLAGQYIPGGAFVSVPFRAIMHDKRCFSQPDVWRPERFINPDKEDVFKQSAFIPFSFGPFNCAGRSLAALELRIFLTAFALEFDGKLADGFDADAFEDSVRDRFTVQKGQLKVELTARNVAAAK